MCGEKIRRGEIIVFRNFHIVYVISVLGLVASTLLTQPAQVQAQEDWRSFSPDVDGDGLLNVVEDGGWTNAAGGPFVTDYLDADSDDDGLTDGQEKLYDTDPLDDRSPGVYVEYQNDLQTREYFPWRRHGSKYIALSSPGHDSVVVRRGSTFSVGGPPNAQLQIYKSQSWLTTITAERDQCSGRWDVYVPNGGTTGIYTLTMQDGDWAQSMNLYVIFELPTGVSDTFRNAFVYDDNPDWDKDSTSLGYYEGETGTHVEYDNSDYSWIPPGQWVNHGYVWSYDTFQFDQHIFEDYVIPTINGTSDTWSAANALVKLVDDVTCFGNPRPLADTYCVLYPAGCAPYYDNRNQCTNIANLFVAFNRSAGIPSRTVWVDWTHSTFDHSTEVWTQPSWGSMGWYVGQGYAGGEGSCPSPRFSGGYTSLTSTSGWYVSQGVYAAGEDWTWDHLDGGGWPGGDDFRQGSWDSSRIVKKYWYETRFAAYMGWGSEPTVTGSPPEDWPWYSQAEAGASSSAGGGLGLPTTLEGSGLEVGQVVSDYGVDEDGDGRYDRLVFEVNVNAQQAGDYWIQGLLGGDYSVPVGGSAIESIGPISLAGGPQTVALSFDGKDLYLNQANGPYHLEGVWITDVANPTKSDFSERPLAYAKPEYETSVYRHSDFGMAGAKLTGVYTPSVTDTDGDGWADALVLETGLNVEQADTYTVQGTVYDGQGGMLAQASWTGSGPQVSLEFEGLRDTEGPYSLEHLHVRNSAGEVTDGIKEPHDLGELPELSAKPVSLGVRATVPADIGATFVITDGYSHQVVDSDGNGQYDQLVIASTVEVEPGEGGKAYRLEGWLVDKNDNLISWASSDAQVLSEGLHVLSLAFDGQSIHERGLDGPYKLVALKALPGDTYDVLNEVNVAYTTPAFEYDEFEAPAYLSDSAAFGDDMEGGISQWVANGGWSLSDQVWYSANHAWATENSGELTTIALDLSEHANPTLTYRTCYAMQTGQDAGYVEVSTDGSEWTKLATYSNSAANWAVQFLNLSDYGQTPSVLLRFNADSQGGLEWYVDDVYITQSAKQGVYLPMIIK
jgi:hypothetical protein